MTTYRVAFLDTDQRFDVEEEELILDAALRQNQNVFYSCRNGTCRTCMMEIVEGTVRQLYQEDCNITGQEIAMNRRLLCMSICESDAVLQKPQRRKRVEFK